MAATLPGRTHGLGLITKPMLAEMEISKGAYSWMNCAATLIGALFCMPCGWIIDRGGLRHLLGGVIALLGMVVYWMSQTHDPTSLAIAVTLTRGLGQSMLSVISITMVAKWFQRRLAPAMGIYSVLMSLMMVVATVGLLQFVTTSGWRMAWGTQGLILLGGAPVLWFLMSNAPRDLAIEFGTLASDKKAYDGPGPTWMQALQTPCFWIFALAISLFGLLSAGLSLFQEFVLNERGLGRETYQLMLGVGLLVGMVSNLGSGWLASKFDLRRLLAMAMLTYAVALAGFPFVRTNGHVTIYAVVQGLAGGMLTVLFFSVWGKLFAGEQLGRIQGAAQMLTVLASALGPVMVEQSRAATGSYVQVFAVAAVVAAALGIIAWFIPLPSFANRATVQ